uniref:hypothetical protein n=1 Tax=Actinokineospora sp. CA-119265 TaxID=3239890 RepID=UPI003F497AE8
MDLDPDTKAVLVGLALLGIWVLAALWWPWTRCTRCKGGGKHFSPRGENWRTCPRCGGTGKRLRTLARLLGRGD